MPFVWKIKTTVSVAALLIAAGVFGARAQDSAAPAPAEAPAAVMAPEPARDPTDVVARIGDETITEADLAVAQREFGSELGQIPEAEQRRALIDAVVNMRVLAKAAEDAKLDQGPEFTQRLEFLREQALRNAYVEANIVNSLTPEDIQKGYEALVLSQHKPEEQLRARHILLETKEDAQKVIEELKAGKAFEELAKQSKDPTGEQGGDLGFFGRGQMVPPFEEAAFKLEPGAVTQEPVQSEFGWHVIKLEEKRMSAPPPLAEVEDSLRNHLMRQKFESAMNDLRKKYAVEIVAAPAVPAQPQAAAPAAGSEPPPAAEAQPDPAAAGEAPKN